MKATEVYRIWLESTVKFDYYVTGGTLALFAYFAKSLTPLDVHSPFEIIRLLGTGLLLAAGALGLKRIEGTVGFLSITFDRLVHEEKGQAYAAAAETTGYLQEMSSGKVLGPDEIASRSEWHRKAIESREGKLDEISAALLRRYRWRNRCLIVGLVLVALAQLWPREASPAPLSGTLDLAIQWRDLTTAELCMQRPIPLLSRRFFQVTRQPLRARARLAESWGSNR